MALVGYWPLNESSGSKAYDHSGRGNHGAVNDGGDSTVLGAPGILEQNAYSFDGSNDYVDLGVSSSLTTDLEQGFTFSVWINTGSTSDQRILDNDYSQNSFYFMLLEGKLTLAINDSSWQQVQSSSNPADGSWHHVVGRFNGSEIEIYIDGMIEGGKSGVSASFFQNSVHIGVKGQDLPDSYTQAFNGKMSELRVYDRPLTGREIQYLYSVGKRGLQTTSKKSS